MPELPEVETIRRVLNRELEGAVLSSCEFIRMRPWNPKSTRMLSHIFHPFKESLLSSPPGFRSVPSYLKTYEQAFLQVFKYLEQKKLRTITRRGKYLLFNFITPTDSPVQLVTHLKMAGKFLLNPPQLEVSDPKQHIHLVLQFKKRTTSQRLETSVLVYSDTRFGEIIPFVSPAVMNDFKTSVIPFQRQRAIYEFLNEATARRLGRIGLEPLGDPVGDTSASVPVLFVKLKEMLERYKQKEHKKNKEQKKARALHRVLLEGTEIAGIGNIYANEICYHARLHPLREFKSLTTTECRRLAVSIPYILSGAIEGGGTSLDFSHVKATNVKATKKASTLPEQKVSLSDSLSKTSSPANHFRLPDGSSGSYARTLQVYGRMGNACLRSRCLGVVERKVHYGRSVYACSHCQQS